MLTRVSDWSRQYPVAYVTVCNGVIVGSSFVLGVRYGTLEGLSSVPNMDPDVVRARIERVQAENKAKEVIQHAKDRETARRLLKDHFTKKISNADTTPVYFEIFDLVCMLQDLSFPGKSRYFVFDVAKDLVDEWNKQHPGSKNVYTFDSCKRFVKIDVVSST